MRALIYALVFFTTIISAQQQTAPYAEFYKNAGDTLTSQNKMGVTGALKAKIFSSSGKLLNAEIRKAEISLVRNGIVVQKKNIENDNLISLNELRSIARPGDRLLLKILEVEDLNRKTKVYLGKTDFSFALE